MTNYPTQFTEQEIANQTLDPELRIPMFVPVGFDGQNAQRPLAGSMDQKIVTNGDTIYIALAAPGTAESDPKWQVKRVVVSGDTTRISFAGGSAAFIHTATDLAGLFV